VLQQAYQDTEMMLSEVGEPAAAAGGGQRRLSFAYGGRIVGF